MEIIDQYFEEWNKHNGEGVAATFSLNGVYKDPSVGLIDTTKIADMVYQVSQMWNNLHFDIISKGQISERLIATEWLMQGEVNGTQVKLEGSDFIRISDDGKIASVTGYFDTAEIQKQLANVDHSPNNIPASTPQIPPGGPINVGTSMRMSTGKMEEPKAISVTYISPKEGDPSKYNETTAMKIFQELMGMETFLGGGVMRNGDRHYTVTLWNTEDGPRSMLRGGTHKEAVSHFFSTEFAEHGMTSVWTPIRIKQFVECKSCGKNEDWNRNEGVSVCGEKLTDPRPLF